MMTPISIRICPHFSGAFTVQAATPFSQAQIGKPQPHLPGLFQLSQAVIADVTEGDVMKSSLSAVPPRLAESFPNQPVDQSSL